MYSAEIVDRRTVLISCLYIYLRTFTDVIEVFIFRLDATV